MARLVRERFEEEEIEVMPRPAQSPDLNHIENLYDSIAKGVEEQNFCRGMESCQECLGSSNFMPKDSVRQHDKKV